MNDLDTSYVNYFKKQFLRAEDFSDEQSYHQAMRRRHNIAHHTWGIVQGLEVVVEEGSIAVQPGFAIDGYGRELILVQKLPIRGSVFIEKGSSQLDVWLLYNRRGSDQPGTGYTGCDPQEGDGLYYRWQEFPLLRLTASNPDETDRRRPPGVPEADLEFPPFRYPPDDPLREWSVFLGQILYDPNSEEPYSANLSGRPYAGLVGGQVKAPSGQARLQVGHEQESDPLRFGVFIEEAHPTITGPRLGIDRNGEISLRGQTTVEGNLTLVNGAVEFGVGEVRGANNKPWRVYRTKDKIKVPDDAGALVDLETDELRIEIDKGSAKGENRFVIGTWSEQSKRFEPCLVVDNDCTVTLRGNLVVEGTLTEVQPRKQGLLTEEAKAFVVASTLSGIGGASAVIPMVFNRMSLVTPEPLLQPMGFAAVEMPRPAAFDPDDLVQKLDADPEALKAFSTALKQNQALLRRLRPMIRARGG